MSLVSKGVDKRMNVKVLVTKDEENVKVLSDVDEVFNPLKKGSRKTDGTNTHRTPFKALVGTFV